MKRFMLCVYCLSSLLFLISSKWLAGNIAKMMF